MAELHVPDPVHGLVETSASLNHEFRDEGDTSAIDVRVSTIDDELRGEGPVRLLKIDVESTEHDVLAGAATILERDRPLVILEVLHVGDHPALEEIRARYDYVDVRLRPADVTVGDSVRFDPDAWNHLWVPADRLDEVLTTCRASGLEIRDRGADPTRQ